MSVAVVLLPAASVVVTLASTVVSASAARSLPATLMVKAPPATSAGVGVAVDRQGDGVAVLDVAADGAGDRHRAAGLGGIDDVVGGDGGERDRGRRPRCRPYRLGVGRRGAVAGGVGGGDAGIDRGVASAARSLPAT